MNVGELRVMLEGVSDDRLVVAYYEGNLFGVRFPARDDDALPVFVVDVT